MTELRKHAIAELERLDIEGANLVKEKLLEMIIAYDAKKIPINVAEIFLTFFTKLAKLEPLTPLTGDDDEWSMVDAETFQNNRCPRVFKDVRTNVAFDIRGFVFIDINGQHYVNKESQKRVAFPYIPITEYIPTEEHHVQAVSLSNGKE